MPSAMQSPSLAPENTEALFCSGSTLSFEDEIKIKTYKALQFKHEHVVA